jgi:hypothetical protein
LGNEVGDVIGRGRLFKSRQDIENDDVLPSSEFRRSRAHKQAQGLSRE